MLAAAVGTAGDVDLDVLIESGQPRLEILHHPPGEAFGLRQRELAELGPGAGDGASPEGRATEPEPGRLDLLGQPCRPVLGDVQNEDVLHVGRPELARPVAVGEIGDGPHVGGTHPPAKDSETRVGVAVLLLGMNADVVAVHVVGGIVGDGRVQPKSDAALELIEEALGRPAVGEEEELQPRLLPVLTQHVAIPEDLRDALDHGEDLVPVDEGVQAHGQMRVCRESAADAHREADLARLRVPDRGHSDIVDLRVGAPGAAAGDGDLVFSGQVVEFRVAVQHPVGRQHQRRGVHDLIAVHAGHRASGDIARRVPARAQRRQTAAPEALEDLGQVLDPDPVELDVLAHREVGDPARVLLGQIGDRAQLVRVEDSVGNPDPHHQVGHGLALAALASHRAHAVALRVHAPEPEVGLQPRRRNRLEAFAGEADDLRVRVPGIQ